MPSNACFHSSESIGVKKLQNILQSIAWLYPDIGYCQGMGMVRRLVFFPIPSVVIIETVRSREIFNKSCLENVEG